MSDGWFEWGYGWIPAWLGMRLYGGNYWSKDDALAYATSAGYCGA